MAYTVVDEWSGTKVFASISTVILEARITGESRIYDWTIGKIHKLPDLPAAIPLGHEVQAIAVFESVSYIGDVTVTIGLADPAGTVRAFAVWTVEIRPNGSYAKTTDERVVLDIGGTWRLHIALVGDGIVLDEIDRPAITIGVPAEFPWRIAGVAAVALGGLLLLVKPKKGAEHRR